ncbi:MAG: orotidine-5'-phosphate decarboxylase [Fastidiosipilaceae bacterium]|jgi:orotidine-5'-phosphate decarboxylase|nr:orotidine-5'-phosphate decarboxylase [Clostridiaceae bacterium]
MTNFADRLLLEIKHKNNPTVLGLDPKLSYVPEFLVNEVAAEIDNPLDIAGEALYRFNVALIDEVADIMPAVKLQLAYYEMYGIPGLRAFRRTCSYANEQGLTVIADGKRNDIGSTAAAYANAYLGSTELTDDLTTSLYTIDALTVNGYLGFDGIEPFLNVMTTGGKGCFILVRTSNPSAKDFQDLVLENGDKLYEAVADKVNTWGELFVGELGYSSVGAVVGATWPEQAAELRQRMPRTLILVPGYGAQGATGADVAVNFDENGMGAIVNASRSLMCAWQREENCDPEDFAGACRRAAEAMQKDLLTAIEARIG